MKEKNEKGITLIALVVTIVVLLILAGVTINLLFSNGGIFDIANQAKIEHEIGALKDRINNVIADWSIGRAIDSTVTVDDLWDKMVDADIIDNPDEDVAGPEKDGENDRYELTTNEGYIVEIIISPDGNVSIGDVVKGDKLPPKIGEITSTSESNSIHIEVEITRSEGEVSLSYYYKKDGEPDSSYQTLKEGVKELTADFTGLEQDVVYNIKVIVKDDNGTAEKIINERTGELKEGTVTQKGETVWSNGTATIELETTETGVTIQYQIDGIEGQWLDYKGPITGLNHGQTVYALITDGTNQSGHTSIDILDEIAPTVTVTQENVTTNSIQVSASSSDAEWGMPDSITYNYYIKQTSEGSYPTDPTHTGTETSYTFIGLIQNTSYDVKVTTNDKAGNPGEGQATHITTDTVGGAGDDLKEGNIIASEPTWSNGSASITLSKGTGVASNFTIQYQVGDVAEGNWTTAQEGAASVTVTGLSHNNVVYARLTDGTNYGSYASVTILDKLPPQTAKIELSGQSTTTTGSITATVTHADNESGIDIKKCKWVYNTTSIPIGTEEGSYTGGSFSGNGQTINLTASTAGIYYLHVLTVDMAGNATETISNPITINQLITQLTLDHTELILEEGQSSTLTAQILPENATNKTLSWESNNTAVATVENGTIYAVQEGNAVITVKTTDGSNLTATCNITVNKPLPTVKDTLKEGQYVQYVDKSGIPRKCIVIYDSTSGYGTQIVTESGVDSVTIGVEDDLKTSIEEYNNAVNALNTKAREYLNTDYASSARCLGSNPINPAAQSGYYRDKNFDFSEYNGKLRDGDENYVSDLEKIKSYNRSCRNVWLASRYVAYSEDSGRITFYISSVGTSSSKYTVNEICIFGSSISDYSKSETMGICPVFTLKDNVKINGGSGTSGDPYTLTI